MKKKMHLMAAAPNEGARRVAQWVARDHGGDLDSAAARVWVTASLLQRILDGEVAPGLALGASLSKACDVKARMFNRPPRAGWFFEPAAQKLAA